MAKKSKQKSKKNRVQVLPENSLPQNILPIGERVEENKNIYISQSVYKEIHKFTKNKTTNESGGMLVGDVIEELGKTNILISGFIEAKYCEATTTNLTFTHETWEYVHKEIEKKHKGKKIVGWIHTHPDFGIFLSEYDTFIQQNFFNEDFQVAYVIDPIQHIEGFYFWINGRIEKCKGFYIFDKTGTKIDINGQNDGNSEEEPKSFFSIRNIIITMLSIITVLLIFSNLSANKRISTLEQQQEDLIFSINQHLSNIYLSIDTEIKEVDELYNTLVDAGIIVESADNTASDTESADDTTDSTDTTNEEATDNMNTNDSQNETT